MQGDKGFPDLVLVGRGRVIFAELKTAKGVVSDDQREWIEAIAATPVEVYLWRPADLDEIAEILRRRPAV